MAGCLKTLGPGSVCVIGRKTSAHVVISHKSVSGNHCTLKIQDSSLDRNTTDRDGTENCLKCTITDLSSNGTWINSENSSSSSEPILLVKHRATCIDIGDVIMLLGPRHPQSCYYQFALQEGIKANELVLCRLSHHEHEMLSIKRPRSFSDNEISSKATKKSRILEDNGSHDISLYDRTNKTVRFDTHSNSPPLTPITSNVSVTTTVTYTSSNVTVYAPILEPFIPVSEPFIPVSKPFIPVSESLIPVSEPFIPFVPALSKELSKEQCPKCAQYFNIVNLVSHVDECYPQPIVPISTHSLPSTLSRQQSEELCPNCSRSYHIIELISHVKECIPAPPTSVPAPPTITPAPPTSVPAPPTCVPAPPTSVPAPSPCLPAPEDEDHCQFCLKLFPVIELFSHGDVCPVKKVENSAATNDTLLVERCMRCFKDFPLSEIVTHGLNCEGEMLGSMERFKEFLPSVHDIDAMALSVLTPTQQNAVDYVRKRSKAEASDQYPELCTRVIGLGYTPKDLQKVLHWVHHDAPIIIHLNLDRVLHHLVNDTHYRNLFEIGHGGGTSGYGGRRGWENRMFNKIYHSSPPVERVKYGVLNIVGDPNGVRCCYSYGDSFLQLKKVRLRTTFASMDTSSSSVKLSCCEHYGNVLNEYSDPELKAILDVATCKKPYLESTMITNYKEIQIHGPVCLSENIDCIVVSPRHRGNSKIECMLDKFVEKNGCNLIWKDSESPIHGIGGFPSY